MSARPAFRRPRVLAAAAATIALAASLAVAAPAEATGGGFPALQPRTYAASLITPTGAITRGVDTPFQIKVTNTSTAISALDRIRVKIPEGFTVTSKGTVAFPRPGWSESLSGSTLTIATNKPLTSALRKGEMLTFTFTAKATPTSCAAMPSTWPLNVDGIFLVYSTSGAPLSTTVPAVADTFVVGPAPDVNLVLDGNQIEKGSPFSVSGVFKCGEEAAPAGANGTVSLTQTSAGTPTGGSLSSALTTVNVGDATATISGATFDKAANGVGIDVKWNTAVSGSFTVDVLGADGSDTSDGHPGAELAVAGATTTLKHGANGDVSLAVVACDPATLAQAPCSDGTQIELTGDFKDLYTNDDPASMTWVCATTCPHHEASQVWDQYFPPPPQSVHNCTAFYSCYQSASAPFGLRDVEEDFKDNPVWVSLKVVTDGVTSYTTFAPAGRCVSTPTLGEGFGSLSSYVAQRSHFLTASGHIEDLAAQHAGFCVDVNEITRDADGLHIPILFVEDPRLRP